jgi:hypothetical protein
MHKFAYKWRSWTISNSVPPQLVVRGEMDLTTMDSGGKLTLGKHTDEFGVPRDIEGLASNTVIKLYRLDGRGRWEGELTYDQNGSMVINGKHFVPDRIAETDQEDRKLDKAAQTEEPWVITKP